MDQQVTQSPILQIEHHSKIFPNVTANDNISFDVIKGEIHCLLGENGAGKSTLAECIYGAYKADGGCIKFKGIETHFNSPRDAIKMGIGIVHQHFVLVPPMTVLENIVVGTGKRGLALNLDQAAEKVTELCQNYGIDLKLNDVVAQLSVGQQQWVEILKALFVGVDLLILDEPTAVLTPKEIERLFKILNKMRSDGLSIILITHKLKEVMEISDRVTVLRKGKLVATVNTSDMTLEDLAKMMVGREVVFKVPKKDLEPGNSVLQIQDVHASNDNKSEVLHGISINVRQYEIVGLAGVAGNGQRELFDVIVGARKATSGKVLLKDQEVTNLSPREMIAKGVASIPQDRIQEGLLMDFKIEENLILGMHRDPQFRRGLFFNGAEIDKFSQASIADYDIATPSGKVKARTLSGGNLQKVILARELSQNPGFVVASSPTRGLDVGATQYVHRRLVELREQGAGILVISEDLDEIFNLSDTIAVIYKGQIMGIINANEATLEQVGLLMAGIRKEVA